MDSKVMKSGFDKAPQRSLLHALGLTEEEIERPLVGIVSSYNEIVPGHMNLDKICEAVKMGVSMAGGTPIVFPAIAVCDGIAMGHKGMKYSLVTRDLIADSTEAMALAHAFDALVMIPNCDKNVPGLLMAAARINVPTIFVSGGPMLAGHVKGHKTSLSSMFEAVGAYQAGKISEEELKEYELNTCPTCGSCSGMYTANSHNCLTEVLGMGLAGNGTIPAVYSKRIELAKHAGMQVMELYRKNIRPRDIMTKEAFENALTADMALGCSTNSMLHLPAIANECGIVVHFHGNGRAIRVCSKRKTIKAAIYHGIIIIDLLINRHGCQYRPIVMNFNSDCSLLSMVSGCIHHVYCNGALQFILMIIRRRRGFMRLVLIQRIFVCHCPCPVFGLLNTAYADLNAVDRDG